MELDYLTCMAEQINKQKQDQIKNKTYVFFHTAWFNKKKITQIKTLLPT